VPGSWIVGSVHSITVKLARANIRKISMPDSICLLRKLTVCVSVRSVTEEKRQSSTFVACSENRAKLTPPPSHVAPRGFGLPGQTRGSISLSQSVKKVSANPVVDLVLRHPNRAFVYMCTVLCFSRHFACSECSEYADPQGFRVAYWGPESQTMDRMAPGLDRYHRPESSARGPIVRAQTSVFGESVGLRDFCLTLFFPELLISCLGKLASLAEFSGRRLSRPERGLSSL
jgi:hypothetical protein